MARSRLSIGRPADDDTLLVPRWVPWLFVLFAVALAPWVVWLLVTLPSQEVAAHWEIAWGGFDIGVAVLLVATAVSLIRRSPSAAIFSAMAAAFLICDAWFDVLTSRGTTKVALALAEAFLVELPLAAMCLWIARNVERVVGDVRPFLERAGFTVEARNVAPPDRT